MLEKDLGSFTVDDKITLVVAARFPALESVANMYTLCAGTIFSFVTFSVNRKSWQSLPCRREKPQQDEGMQHIGSSVPLQVCLASLPRRRSSVRDGSRHAAPAQAKKRCTYDHQAAGRRHWAVQALPTTRLHLQKKPSMIFVCSVKCQKGPGVAAH